MAWSGGQKIDWKLAGARFLTELDQVTEGLKPELKQKMEVAIFCPDVTLEEVANAFEQYGAGGEALLSQNDWKDSTVRVLRTMASLGEFSGVQSEWSVSGDIE
jgi:hypothetical protein